MSYPNPVSKYDEDTVVYGLTLYELNRKPRLLDEKRDSVTVELGKVREDCQCAICLGILQSTTTVMECTHRFCKNCIETSLRTHKNECPTCRLHIPSRRSLRPDHAFDALVRTFYPDVDSFEKSEVETMEELRAKTIENLAAKVKQGLDKQRKAAKAFLAGDAVVAAAAAAPTPTSTSLASLPPPPASTRTKKIESHPSATPAMVEARRRLEKRRRVARENDVELALLRHPLETDAVSVVRRGESIVMVPPEFTVRAAKTLIEGKLRGWGESAETTRRLRLCTRDIYGFDRGCTDERETMERLLGREGRAREGPQSVRSLVVYYALHSDVGREEMSESLIF